MLVKAHSSRGLGKATYLALILSLSSIVSLNVVLPSFIVNLGGNLIILGTVYSLQSFVRPLARIMSSIMSKAISRKYTIILSIIARLIAFLLLYYANNVIMVAISMLLLALAQGLENPTFLSSTADIITNSEIIAMAFGIILSIRMAPSIIAPILTGYIAEILNTRYVFLSGLILSLTSLLFSLRIKLDTSVELEHNVKSNYLKGVRNLISREFHLLCTSTILLFMVVSAFQPLFSYWIVEELNYGYIFLGYLLSLGGLVSFFSRIISGWLADRLGEINVLIGVGLLRTSSMIILAFTHSPLWIGTSYILTRLLMAAPPRNALIAKMMNKNLYDVAYSTIGVIMDIGRTLGPFLLSYITKTFNFQISYITMALLLQAYIISLYFLKREMKYSV